RSAVHACADSCTVSENSSTMKAMKICATLMSSKGTIRLRPTREKRKDGVGDFSSDGGLQVLPRRAPHARHAAKRRQQCAPPAGTNAGHVVKLRSQVAHRTRAAVKRHRKTMGLVPDPLNQEQPGVVHGKGQRAFAVACEEQLLLLGNPDGEQIRQA